MPASSLSPGHLPPRYFVICSLGFGLVLAACSYLILVELGVPCWTAGIVVSAYVAASPATILYENSFMYALPTASMVVLSTWALIRFLRTNLIGVACVFFCAICTVALLNSTYQWPWVLPPLAAVLLACRRRWRPLILVALAPVLVLGAWYTKNAVMFGTYTTSSWLGMNLAKTTIFLAPSSQLHRLGIAPYTVILDCVPPRDRPHTGVPALDEVRKTDGSCNYNNLFFVGFSRDYLHRDLAYIAAEPIRLPLAHL